MRRTALVFSLGGLLIFAAPAGAKVRGFEYGVTAGEIGSKSVRVWGKTQGSGKARAVVARDRRFRRVVRRKRVRAKRSNDNTVQTRIKKLRPNKRYFYRFCARGAGCSDNGRFRTAPRPSQAKSIRFAYSADTDGTRLPGADEPFFGTFEVFRSMWAERNDFNIHLGDTMYSDSGVGGRPPALTVGEKWGKYKENLEQENLIRLRRKAGLYSHWDDHEFINDFSIPEDGRTLYNAGVKAFRDYAPVRFTMRNGIYRTFRWGRNAELFFLDMRSFRSAKAEADGVCDNPETGSPDVAPTAPQGVRNAFSALVPALATPVTQQCRDTINDPDRTMLGQRQYRGFIRDLERSNARWKLIVNELPMQQFYVNPYDQWEGYAFERLKLLNELEQRGIGNLLFLTTDSHAAYANVVRKRTLPGDVAPSNAPAEPTDTAYHDFVIGPVATNTRDALTDNTTGIPGAGTLVSELFLKPNPPGGVGMLCAQGDVYSYAQVTVRRNRVTVTYKDENGDPVIDVDGEPCGPYTITPFAP